MKIGKAVASLVVIVSGAAFAQGEPAPSMTMAEFDEFMHRYYIHPQPERVPAAIAYLDARDDSSLRNAQIPITIFFSHLYAANAKFREQWDSSIRGIQDPRLKKLLAIAASNSPDVLVKSLPESAEKNDAHWACFFATGSSACLDPIIANLRYMSERGNLNLFGVGASAKWSLAANISANPLVRIRVERALQDSDPVIKANASDVLNRSPEEIQNESIEIIRANHKAGNW